MIAKKSENDYNENEVKEMQEKLQEIKDQEGIIGYIFRGSKLASIDLNDPKRIIDYANLSSTSFDESLNMTETLQLGEVESIIVESEKTKLLSMNVSNHCLSIFMEKSFDHNKLYKNLK
jgi:hypothetical protein